MYIGARLNESLPVSHWYGMDTILRSAPEAKLNPSVTDAGIAWITRGLLFLIPYSLFIFPFTSFCFICHSAVLTFLFPF